MPSIPLYKHPKQTEVKGWYSTGITRIATDVCIVHEETSKLQEEARHILSSEFEGPHWKSLKDAGIISQRDLELVMKLDRNRHFKTFDEEKCTLEICNQMPTVFLTLLESIRKENDLKYTIVMLDHTLHKDHSRSQLFEGKNLSILFTLLTKPNDFIQNMAARVLSRIAFWKKGLISAQDMEYYLAWIKTQFTILVSGEKKEYLQNTIRCLQTSLRINECKHLFLSMQGVKIICDLFNTKPNFQIQYQLCYCLWIMSYNSEVAEKITQHDIIRILADVLKSNEKEKVSRMILAFFRNIIEKPKSVQVIKDNCIALIRNSIFKRIEFLEYKNYEDEDIIHDMEFLKHQMDICSKDLSSFDEYASEVRTGKLSWNPLHKSEKFWNQNAAKLNENNYELLKMLIYIARTYVDSTIISVACHDIGEYVRHYPRGKNVLEQLDGKMVLMKLLDHNVPEVRNSALTAVSKLMVHNWEFMLTSYSNNKI